MEIKTSPKYLVLGAQIKQDGSFTVFFKDTKNKGHYPTFDWSPQEGARILDCCGLCGITHKARIPILVDAFDLGGTIDNDIFSYDGEEATIDCQIFFESKGYISLT